jgi:hypothetical protein
MANNKHLWAGIERPAHVENDKEWVTTVQDELDNLAEGYVRKVFELVYGHEPTEADASLICDLTAEIRSATLDKGREYGVPIWFPTSDTYGF